MKYLLIFCTIILFSCNNVEHNKSVEQASEFISAIEISALDINGKEVKYNVGYTIYFDESEIISCGLKNKDELHDIVIKNVVRSVVRQSMSKLDSEKPIDKEEIRTKINQILEQGEVNLDGKTLTNCRSTMRLIGLTKK